MKFAAVAKDVTTWRQIQPKLDLQQVQQSAKRLRADTPNSSSNYDDDNDDDGDEDDGYLVDSLINELDYLNNKVRIAYDDEDMLSKLFYKKWIEAETRAINAEIDVRAQVSKENDNELRKMEEMYLLALKREVKIEQSLTLMSILSNLK